LFNIDIKPKRVVLVGDSAGGNLVLALTLRCIKRGIRIPDGILVVYPGELKIICESPNNVTLIFNLFSRIEYKL